MFLSYRDAPPVETAPGVRRRVLAHDETLMLVEFSFEGGVRPAPHSHPHSQVSYVKSGRVEYLIGGETAVLEAGDSAAIPPGVPHNCLPLTDAVLVDVFTPPREDFL